MSMFKRKRVVTDHAIEQFRARLQWQNDVRHRDGTDIGNLIDWAISSAMSSEKVERITSVHGPASLVDLSAELDDGLWAVLVENRSKNRNEPRFVVRTVLTAAQVKENRTTGWYHAFGAVPNAESVSKLAISIAIPTEEKVPSTPLEQPAQCQTRVVLLRYTRSKLSKNEIEYQECASREEATERIKLLALDPYVDRPSMRVFEELVTNIAVEVKVDLG